MPSLPSTFTILGSTGFVGGALVSALRARGHRVFYPARDAREAIGHVIYAIGVTADFRRRPLETVEAHVGVLREILARGGFESLTYLSSTRVYARADHGSADRPIPVDPRDPSDLYNLSKLAGESLCLHGSGGRGRVVRLSNVVGPVAQAGENFVDALVREARAGRIVLRSDPDSAKDYIALADVVEMLPRIAAEGRDPVYNLASGLRLRHRAWTDALQRATGCVVEFTPGAPLHSFPDLDIGPLRAQFSFSPRPVLDLIPDLLR